MSSYDFLIVGAGIYGSTTAIELHKRGHRVRLIDPGPIPHPLAASTDVSKVVRMEYGDDADYMRIVDESIDGWLAWNDLFDDTLFHQTGVTMFTRRPLEPGMYEYESFHLAKSLGHSPERMDADTIARRFPAWNADVYVDGYYHARGGYAESGRVVETLVDYARQLGVDVLEGQTAADLLVENGRVTGVRTREGSTFSAGHTVVCAGAWTPYLVPGLLPFMKATGHPVFHLKPSRPDLFTPPNFAVFTADVSNTGWYGFPLHPREGIIKIANHGVGQHLHPEHDERVVTPDDEAHLRHMLRRTFPALADDPIVYTRRCLYNDTLDEHLWIDRHPELDNLSVGAGGSGHAFKMGPVLGELIADTAEGKTPRWHDKFKWRDLIGVEAEGEASRYHGDLA